jgi:PhoPQ-activated pathogenicity-related protein
VELRRRRLDRVKTESKPSAARLWQAENPNARDFRLATIRAPYTNSSLSDQGDGFYVGMAPKPKQGWTACFVEMTFPTDGPYSFKFTTGVRVTPDRLPFGSPPETEARRGAE